jgi:hypothetical protein
MKTITRRALIVFTSLAAIALGSLAQAMTPQLFATMMTLTGAGGGGGGGVGASFTAGPSVATNAVNLAFANQTKTFLNTNNGTNFPPNSTVLFGFSDDLASVPITPQIGGQTATQIAVDSASRCRLYQATMPGTSQTDTFSFATGGNFRAVGIVLLGYFQNLQSNTVSATAVENYGVQSDPQSLTTPTSVTVPSAPAWGIAYVYSVTNPTAVTWTSTTVGAGDNFYSVVTGGGNVSESSAHTTTVGSWSPTVSGVTTSMNSAACMVAGTWH